jgi:hypothetical protein
MSSSGANATVAPTTIALAATVPQNGVVLSGDLAQSAFSINTSTGALGFTLASANPVWVKSSAGVLTPVNYTGVASTLTPGSLPASTKYAVYGVEITSAGALALVKGTDTATQINTGSLIASNTPATTSGSLRIIDFAVWNNAGTINYGDQTTVGSQGVNWIDRRPWARGFYQRIVRNSNAAAGNDYTRNAATYAYIDSTNLAVRAEVGAGLVRIGMQGTWSNSGVNSNSFAFMVDGSGTDGAPNIGGSGGSDSSAIEIATGDNNIFALHTVVAPGAGSHLVAPAWLAVAGTVTMLARATFPLRFYVREDVTQAASNGAA